MASKYENLKEFLILEITPEEAKAIGFGISEGCICMHCNGIIKDNIYYIAALNDVMCLDCLEKWLDWAEHYDEDTPIEKRNYNFYKTLLEKFGYYV